MNHSIALIAAAWLFAAASAHAATYKIAPKESFVSFSATQNGAPAPGRFPVNGGAVTFDPKAPEKSGADVSVSVAGVSAAAEEMADTLKTAEWLDAKSHPTAQFVSDGFARIEGKENLYHMTGALTLKGVTLPVSAHVVILEQTPERLKATAEFPLNRLNFGVGWKDASAVKADVSVRADVTAYAAP
jgi:polyisoprenoid-binding protein YceI